MQQVYFVVFNSDDVPEIRSDVVDQESIEEGFYIDSLRIYITPEMVCETPAEAEARLQFVRLELGIETPVYH
jgi:hypothetical protein